MLIPATPHNLDLTLMALADPTRRAIIERLQQGETRVTDLAAPFPLSLNAVSKHIRVLERADLVRRRRLGREHLLTLNPAPLREAVDWIAQQEAAWNRRLDALEHELSALSGLSAIGYQLSASEPPDTFGSSDLEESDRMTNADHCISVTRKFAATPEEVYAAWTETDLMQRWMGHTIEGEVRVGERYHHEMTGDDGKTYIHTGEYLVLEPPTRIVQTLHGYPKGTPAPDHREFLEITLRPINTTHTELTLADCWDGEGMDAEGEEAVKAAWSGWLDGLARMMGSLGDRVIGRT